MKRLASLVGVVAIGLLGVTGCATEVVGDEVVFLGSQEGPLGSDVITAEAIAAYRDPELANTIADAIAAMLVFSLTDPVGPGIPLLAVLHDVYGYVPTENRYV